VARRIARKASHTSDMIAANELSRARLREEASKVTLVLG
jgi:hypothetical protein